MIELFAIGGVSLVLGVCGIAADVLKGVLPW